MQQDRFSTEGVQVNEHGNNTALSFADVDDARMRELGFTDRVNGSWYMCRAVGPDITLNVTVRESGDWRIDVLDENFCQPYDYQHILAHTSNPCARECAEGVATRTEAELSRLSKAGLLLGWYPGIYV